MNRDPYYYLQKADHFYRLAERNGYDVQSGRIVSNKNNEEAIEFVSDDDDYTEENYDDEYIEDDDGDYTEELDYTDELKPRKIAPMTNRLYDPLTKHYYKSSEIPAGITRAVPKNADAWYPENKLPHKTITDPTTGKRYRVYKIYDNNGSYHFEREELVAAFRKKPGTNYYRPVNLAIGK